jgi:Arc/MetJ family transcription regulator
MKRTNLVLDEQLLEEAVRLSGERTYSRAVERALEEFVRLRRARRILELAGSGVWEGDLAEMRGDVIAGVVREASARRPGRSGQSGRSAPSGRSVQGTRNVPRR